MVIPSILDGYTTIYWSVYTVCITGAISQVLLLICLIKDPLKCFRNSSTYLVANLAAADLVVVLEMIFGAFSSLPPVRSASHVALYASILTILSIAIDRYVMVVHPFKHRFFMSGKKSLIWIVLLWIASIVSPLCHVLTGSLWKIRRFKYGLLATVIVLTALLYAMTCVALRKQAKCLANGEEKHALKTRIANEERFFKTVIIVAVVAVVCLTPATVYAHVKMLAVDSDIKSNVLYCILMTMLCVNFSINPWIYFLRLKNYRKSLFIVLSCRK